MGEASGVLERAAGAGSQPPTPHLTSPLEGGRDEFFLGEWLVRWGGWVPACAGMTAVWARPCRLPCRGVEVAMAAVRSSRPSIIQFPSIFKDANQPRLTRCENILSPLFAVKHVKSQRERRHLLVLEVLVPLFRELVV